MPIASIKALVLGTAPVAEQDREVFLLTEKGELRRAVAPGALKGKNRFGSLLELFCFSDFVYYWREDRVSWTLSKGDLLVSRFRQLSEPENLFYGVFIAEVLWRFHSHQQEHPRLFRLVNSLLTVLDAGLPLREMLPYFMIWVLRLEGLLFSAEKCSSCGESLGNNGGWLRDDSRGLLCHRCRKREANHIGPEWLNYILWTRHNALTAETVKEMALSARPDFKRFVNCLKEVMEAHGELRFKTPLP